MVPLLAAATAGLATQMLIGDPGDVAVPVLVAAAAGLLVGLLAASMVELVDGSIRDQHALAKLTGVPNLAVVARHPIGAQRPDDVAAFRDPNSIEAEGYRSLRTALEFVTGHHADSADPDTPDPGDEPPVRTGPGSIVLVTSPRPGEGKSTVAANLAAVSAMAGRRVILIDGDLRKPQVHRLFRLTNEVGLSSVLAGDAKVAESVRRPATMKNLAVMSAGPPPPDPAELLANGRLAMALSSLAQVADLVVVDAPPLLAVTDATIIVQHCDVVVLVATADLSDRREWAEALPRLAVVGATVAGTVLLQPDDRVQDITAYRYTPTAVPQNWWVATTSESAGKVSAEPVAATSAEPASSAPAEPAGSAPAEPAGSAPVEPAGSAPAEPEEPAVPDAPVDKWAMPVVEPMPDEWAAAHVEPMPDDWADFTSLPAPITEGWPRPSSDR